MRPRFLFTAYVKFSSVQVRTDDFLLIGFFNLLQDKDTLYIFYNVLSLSFKFLYFISFSTLFFFF